MQLAKDLWECYHRKLYTGWGYETFDDYVNYEVEISRDRARRLRRIFEVLVIKCGVQPKELDVIGRSKAERLMTIMDRSTASDWVDKAKNLSYVDLVAEISEVREAAKPAVPVPTEPEVPVLPADGPVKITGVSPKKIKKPKKAEFKVRTFRLPPDVDSLLEEALGEAQRTTNSASQSWNLACIIQHFVAHRVTDEGRDDGRLRWFMRNMERIYGGRLIHVKDDKGWEVLSEAIDNYPEHLGSSAKEISGERECSSGKEEEDHA